MTTAQESRSTIVGKAKDLVWEAPGPGMWVRDPSKQPKPPTGFFKALIPKALNGTFEEVGPRYGLLIEGFHIVDVNGWLYLRPRPLGAPDKPGPPPPRWVMRLLLLVHPGLRARRKAADRALSSRLWLQDGQEWLNGGRDAFVERLRSIAAEDPSRLDREELRGHFTRVMELIGEGWRTHFRDALGHFLSIGDFARHASAWTGVAPQEVVGVLAGSSPFSLAPLNLLDRIVETLNGAPEARQRFLDEARPAEDRITGLREDSPETAAALDEYLLEFGYRNLSGFDLDDKPIAEMPDVLVASIAARLNPRAATQQETDWVRPRVAAEHRPAYDALKAEAEVLYGVRDDDAGAAEWAFGLVRRALLATGELLAEDGALHQPDHILDAVPEEVDAMLRRDPEAPSAGALAERQRRRLYAPIDPPLILGDPEEPPSLEWLPGALGRVNNAIMLGMAFDGALGADARSDETEIPELAGVAASRGVYRGTARIVSTETDFGRLVQGDVIVAPMTTPAYNVVLPLLGAIVTDTGGVLSHAAIVAREYGIPAVVATGSATTSIPDGSVITVDGDRGVVTIAG
jgi:pyruvate,water dikinase